MNGNNIFSLYDRGGNRKYLTVQERKAFLKAAQKAVPEVWTFCWVLAFTGARISEVLAMTPASIDFANGCVVIESLKKRRRGVFRTVPIPTHLLKAVDKVHGVQAKQKNPQRADERIWPWCRTTGWTRIKEVMADATVAGPHATPKGLRHSFGTSGAVETKTPISMLQQWLGHSSIETTAHYLKAKGAEERKIAKRFWVGFGGYPKRTMFCWLKWF